MPDVYEFEMVGSSSIPADVIERSRLSASAIGYAHGWSQGVRDARESMAAEADAAAAERLRVAELSRADVLNVLTSIANAAAMLDLEARTTAAQNETAILHAAMELAEALLGRELRCIDTATQAALSRVLRLAPAEDPVTIRINPSAYATLASDDFSSLLSSVTDTTGREITFEPDAALGVGDAIARCGASTIDARLTEAVARLREHLATDLARVWPPEGEIG